MWALDSRFSPVASNSASTGVISGGKQQLEYHNSSFEDLVATLRQISTKAIAATTGYNPRIVRRLKRREFSPPQKDRGL